MSRRSDNVLPRLVESFFRDHLQRVRSASPHTLRAYRDTLRLFFRFLADTTGRSVVSLGLDDLRVERALAFLDYLEARRGNSPATRNGRLAALHGLVHYLLRQDPTRAGQYQRILAVPRKKARTAPPTYLEPEDVRVLLAQVDAETTTGLRDHALLLLLYNTGARVSEVLAVRPADLELSRPPSVRLHGKGGRDRRCPVWRETAQGLTRLMTRTTPAVNAPLFHNARGVPLSRDGVAYVLAKYVARAARELPPLRRRRITPHVLRHSCAVALLQAGVDVSVIRDYLGHASIATTSRYLTTNLQLKRDALDLFWKRSGLAPSAPARWRPTPDLLAVLEGLSLSGATTKPALPRMPVESAYSR